MFNAAVLITVSVFSLAWFIVGVTAGMRMREENSGKRNRRTTRRRKRSNASGDKIEIYVGNLAYEVADKDVNKLFSAHGRVLSARIIKNKANGKSKGYGFVEMANRSDGLSAVKALNGADVKGRRLVANEARSRSRD